MGWASGRSYQQGSFSSPVAKPPAGSSLLFGALAGTGRIKERKNGSYRMVLKGVDEIDWFTDRPDRVAGEWSPKQLVKKWDGLFGDGDGPPNAQATFEVGNKRKLVTFEMFKPKLSNSNQTLSFKVRGIGKKSKDLLTGLRNKQLSDASLFIDDALPYCFPNCRSAHLYEWDLNGKDLSSADLRGADLVKANLAYADLGDANLYGANLAQANLYEANLNRATLYAGSLRKANLFRASLKETNLSDMTLWDANLREANLKGANLSYSELDGADLTGADLSQTIWNGTTCPDGTKNGGTVPCTAEQLLLA